MRADSRARDSSPSLFPPLALPAAAAQNGRSRPRRPLLCLFSRLALTRGGRGLEFTFLLLLAPFFPLSALDPYYTSYTAFLARHVCNGGVDYAAVVKDSATDVIAREFANVSDPEFSSLDEKSRIAHLINVYNFHTILLIKRNYPLKTGIRDIGRPWSQEFIPLFGKNVSLDYIEHDLLRGRFREPRIHFAVNCASKSCPVLAPVPYTGALLDVQLDGAAAAFLKNPALNRVEGSTLYLSRIFDWYGGDFRRLHGSYQRFVLKTLGLSGEFRVKFLDYDWSLNNVGGCVR